MRAENTAGNGPYASTSATTQTPVVAPSAVRNLAAAAVSASQIDLSWDAPATGTTPFTYRVERATDSAFTQGLTTVNASVSGTSLANAGISANTTYYYRVRAENTAGNGPYSTTVNATTQMTRAVGGSESSNVGTVGESDYLGLVRAGYGVHAFHLSGGKGQRSQLYRQLPDAVHIRERAGLCRPCRIYHRSYLLLSGASHEHCWRRALPNAQRHAERLTAPLVPFGSPSRPLDRRASPQYWKGFLGKVFTSICK